MIYTSYYGYWRKFPPELKLVSVSFHHPDKFPNLERYKLKKLFPPFQLVLDYKSGKITEEQYTVVYLKHLDNAGINFELAKEKLQGCILLCYCAKGKFCHRHVLADYLRKHGIESQEL